MIDWLADNGSMIVLPIFMAVFFGFGIWAYRPSHKKMMDAYGEIPFKEDRNG